MAVRAVPLGASRGEVAELVAVRAEIPRLGDQLHAGQYRVLTQRVEEHRTGVEAVAGAAERGRQVEAEAVDMQALYPVAQGVHHHLQDVRMRATQRVAAAGRLGVEIGRANT